MFARRGKGVRTAAYLARISSHTTSNPLTLASTPHASVHSRAQTWSPASWSRSLRASGMHSHFARWFIRTILKDENARRRYLCTPKYQGTLSLPICYLSSFLHHLPIQPMMSQLSNSNPLTIHLPQRVMKFSSSCEREINHSEWRTNEGDAAEESQCRTDGARPL